MKNEKTILTIIKALFFGVFIIIALIAIIATSQAWILYGDKPITEVPMWALWFLT